MSFTYQRFYLEAGTYNRARFFLQISHCIELEEFVQIKNASLNLRLVNTRKNVNSFQDRENVIPCQAGQELTK